MSWDIIVWCKEDAIDYVPSVWANEDNTFYKYPLALKEKKLREIIYESKDVTENFTWCQVTLKKKNVTSLERAKRLCQTGQYTSNLDNTDSSSDEIEGSQIIRKKRKPTKRLIEEDDEEPEHNKRNTLDLVNVQEVHSEGGTPLRKQFSFPGTPTGNRSCDTPSSEGSQSLSALNTSNTLKQILKLQLETTYEIKDIRKKIEKLETFQMNATSGMLEDENSAFLVETLPCQTVEDLQKLEDKLQDETFSKSLVNLFCRVGGDTLQRSVYLIMRKLACDKVTINYSGQGKKHKLSFCQLKIYQSISMAAMKLHKHSTEEAIRKIVSLYLAQSKARSRHRDTKSTSTNETSVEDE